MKGILQSLWRLQELEIGEPPHQASKAGELRAAIPQSLLYHYDRLRARGKKGIAMVRHQVCTSCRMQVPIAVVATLMRGTVSQECGNCGCYLCLPEPAEAEVGESLVAAHSRPKTPRRKSVRQ
jgi:predicted  nucleic acid-binding Zn-ribbon protein